MVTRWRYYLRRCCWSLALGAVLFACTSTHPAMRSDSPSPPARDTPAHIGETRYASPDAVLSTRLGELSPQLSSAEGGKVQSPVPAAEVAAGAVPVRPHSVLLPELLTLQSGAWRETLKRTESPWSDCLKMSFAKAGDEECRSVGRARAVSLVRLGLRDDAWRLWEAL